MSSEPQTSGPAWRDRSPARHVLRCARKFLPTYNPGLSHSHPCASLENNSRPSVPTQSAPSFWPALMSVSGGAMKDTIPAVPVERHFEQEGFGNRKLIRPLMNHTNHAAVNHAPGHSAAGIGERRDRPDRGERSNGARKSAPP